MLPAPLCFHKGWLFKVFLYPVFLPVQQRRFSRGFLIGASLQEVRYREDPVSSTIVLSEHSLISSSRHSYGARWTTAAPFYRCESWGSEFTCLCKVPRDQWQGQNLRPGFLFWSCWTPSANSSPLDISKLCTQTVCTDTLHFEHFENGFSVFRFIFRVFLGFHLHSVF